MRFVIVAVLCFLLADPLGAVLRRGATKNAVPAWAVLVANHDMLYPDQAYWKANKSELRPNVWQNVEDRSASYSEFVLSSFRDLHRIGSEIHDDVLHVAFVLQPILEMPRDFRPHLEGGLGDWEMRRSFF